MQCFISITAERWNIVRARSKRSIYIRAKSSRYIILLKVKRVCRLDQNTVTMALRRVLFAILIHVDSRRLY